MKKFVAFVFFLLPALYVRAQDVGRQEGVVTFVTAANVYVSFSDMGRVNSGDTLYVSKGGTLSPCAQVLQKSSSSCVCEMMGSYVLKKGDKLIHEYESVQKQVKEEQGEEVKGTGLGLNRQGTRAFSYPQKSLQQRIRVNLTAATYSHQTLPTGEDAAESQHRGMLRLSGYADRIASTPLSLETYMYYRRYMDAGESFREGTASFRVYNLALRYELEDNLKIILGRKTNRKVSSIGAIDGLQFEKSFGDFYTGALVGFKPDYIDFGLNTDLLQYGLYAGHQHRSKGFRSTTTLGVLEQRMLGNIDRRYAYFQHSGTFFKKLNLFGSFELDLYDKVDGVVSMNPRLVNLYVSARYRFSRKFSLSASYDSRRRVIYYESYKTEVERLLSEDEARQGMRLRLQLNPFKYLHASISYSRRFESDNQNQSDNLNGRVSYSRLPGLGGRLSLAYNINESSYLQSRVLSASYSRSLVKRRLHGNFYYRYGDFSYLSSDYAYRRWYAGVDLSYRITPDMRFSLLAEVSDGSSGRTLRLNTKISKKWDSK